MASTSKAAGRQTPLPQALRAFVLRRLTEVLGAMLIGLAVLTAGAVVSFEPTDPSYNHAVDGPVRNMLGLPGAYVADFLLQSLGLVSALLIVAFAVWGWRIAAHQGLSPLWLRVTLLPVGLLAACTALTTVPVPGGWPLTSGLGGATGMVMLWRLGDLAALFGGSLSAGLAGLAAFLIAFAAMVPALAVSRREWSALAAGCASFARAGAAAATRLLRRRDRFGEEAAQLRSALGRAARRADEAERRIEPRFERPAPPEPPEEPPPPRREAAPDLVAPRADGAGARAKQPKQGSLALADGVRFDPPPLELLQAPPAGTGAHRVDDEALSQNARLLESVLDDFGVRGEIVKVRPGPVVTLYELEPAPGTKSSRVIGLADDIARSMSAVSARVAVVPGRNAIGIELPNARREKVFLRELLAADTFEKGHSLGLALGKDIGGAPVVADLARMPHLLIAGTTGSGKSVAINTMILSLLYRLSPEQCRFIMIDPKMLELSVYDDIPHLLSPVVTDPKKAVVALKWTVKEMEQRYRAMSQLGVRNIAGYNQRLEEARRKGERITRSVQTGFDAETGRPVFEEQELDLSPLPFIVVVVDEMADLMLVAGKDIEGAVQRLAQMARAAGIHLIMATQRPSVDVITGTIKANFPTRISFQVTSKIDSRTILGEQGAEQLLGQGDMLHMVGGGRIARVHGPFVSDDEVEAVVRHLKAQGEPAYVDEVTVEEEVGPGALSGEGGDELYDQAVQLVLRERKASTSFIQRHLQIGYNRAARIIEQMEADGVISPANHVGKREVIPGGGG